MRYYEEPSPRKTANKLHRKDVTSHTVFNVLAACSVDAVAVVAVINFIASLSDERVLTIAVRSRRLAV